MLNLRSLNNGIDLKREKVFEDYLEGRYSKFQMKSLDDYEQLKKVTPARTSSVHRRFFEVLWVPVRNRNTFSVPAIDEGGQDI